MLYTYWVESTIKFRGVTLQEVWSLSDFIYWCIDEVKLWIWAFLCWRGVDVAICYWAFGHYFKKAQSFQPSAIYLGRYSSITFFFVGGGGVVGNTLWNSVYFRIPTRGIQITIWDLGRESKLAVCKTIPIWCTIALVTMFFWRIVV